MLISFIHDRIGKLSIVWCYFISLMLALLIIIYKSLPYMPFKFDWCFFIGICSTGPVWGCFGGTRWRTQHWLRLALQLYVLQLWQELLLQVDDDAMWSVHRPVLGMWVCIHYLWPGLVHYSRPKNFQHLHGLRSEILWNLRHVFPCANMWNLWSHV